MTVRYRSATLGEFIEHHSYDVSRGGMFIKTPSPFPPGTLLKFEVKIADEQRVLQGVGRVVWKREKADAGEESPAGMGIKFIKIDDASQSVIERLVDARAGEGAFDQRSQRDSRRMFPDKGTADLPTPEDRVDLKSGSRAPKGDSAHPGSGEVPEAPLPPGVDSDEAGSDERRGSEQPENGRARGRRKGSRRPGRDDDADAGQRVMLILLGLAILVLIILMVLTGGGHGESGDEAAAHSSPADTSSQVTAAAHRTRPVPPG